MNFSKYDLPCPYCDARHPEAHTNYCPNQGEGVRLTGTRLKDERREIDWERISVLASEVTDLKDRDFSAETWRDMEKLAIKKIQEEMGF